MKSFSSQAGNVANPLSGTSPDVGIRSNRKTLLENLPDTPPANPDILPHISRFVALSGITRNGMRNTMQWIRPTL